MLIKLLFGEESEAVVNPSCTKGNFIDYINKVLVDHDVPAPNKECLDIVDTKGVPQNINKLAISANVGELLIDRETYIPVTFQCVEDLVTGYTLILTNKNKLYDKIMSYLTTTMKRPTKRSPSMDQPVDRSRLNLSRGPTNASSKKIHRTASKK